LKQNRECTCMCMIIEIKWDYKITEGKRVWGYGIEQHFEWCREGLRAGAGADACPCA